MTTPNDNVAIFTCHHSRLLCLFKTLARQSSGRKVTTDPTTVNPSGDELAQDLERNHRLQNLATIKMVIDPANSTQISSTSSSSSAPPPPLPTVRLTLLHKGFLSKPDPRRTYWLDAKKSIMMTFSAEIFSKLFPEIKSNTTIYFVRHGEGFHNTVKGWKKLTAPRKLLTDAFLVSSQSISDASTAIKEDITRDYPEGLSKPLGLFSSPLRRCIETLYLILDKMFPGGYQPPSSESSSTSAQTSSSFVNLFPIAEKIIIIPCSGEVNSSKTCDKGLWPSGLENKSTCTALTCTTFEDLFKGVLIKNQGTPENPNSVVDLIFNNEHLRNITIDWSMFFNVGKDECKSKILTQFIGKAFTEEQTPRRGNKTQFLNKQVRNYIQELPELSDDNVKLQLLITKDNIMFPEKDKIGETLTPEEIYDMVWNAIPSNPDSIQKQSEWMKCDKQKHCDSAALHYLWRIERESTIYMLRILNMGYISKDNTRPLIINIDLTYPGSVSVEDARLTGIWSKDNPHVTLELATTGGGITFVLASGPTGAGKTFMGKQICEKLGLPPMISIDGGIYRDCSIVYQIIKHVLHEKGWAGMRNLVFTSTLEKIHSVPRLLRISWTKFFEGIFDTEKVKNLVYQYLVYQRGLKKIKINFPIYVPDTLSFTPSMNDYKDFLALTGYNRSGLSNEGMNIINAMIYQHWEGGEKCPLPFPQRCVGCLASGRAREIREGKKYPDNPDSYNKGVKNSLAILFDESNEFMTRIFIHNTGSPDRSKQSLWYQYSKHYGIVSPITQHYNYDIV